MSFVEKLQKVDRRIIYVLFLVAVMFPLLKPIGVPLSYSESTRMFYDQIESLKAGDRVLVALDYSAGGQADLHPGNVAVTKHLIKKGVRIVYVAFWDGGPMFGQQIVDPFLKDGTLVYGENFANLGYIAGSTTAIRSFGIDPIGTVAIDHFGKQVASLPIMQGVKSIKDFDLVIEYAAGDPGIDAWVQQVQVPTGIKYVAGCVTVSVPGVMPKVDAGQISGLLQGLRGAAEYEVMSGNMGTAAAGMDAQSLGHLVIVAFILVGNISYFLSGGGKKSA